LAIKNKLLALDFGALKELAFRFEFGRGVVSITTLLAHLELLPNSQDENLVAFCLTFVAKI